MNFNVNRYKVSQYLSGRPKPRVRWLLGGLPAPSGSSPASGSETSAGTTVTSRVVLPDLGRADSGRLVTCEAQNNNVSGPVRKTVAIVMNRKKRKEKAFISLSSK